MSTDFLRFQFSAYILKLLVALMFVAVDSNFQMVQTPSDNVIRELKIARTGGFKAARGYETELEMV